MSAATTERMVLAELAQQAIDRRELGDPLPAALLNYVRDCLDPANCLDPTTYEQQKP